MELSDLKNSISGLSDQELMNLIREIRTSRRTPKATTVTKTTKTKSAKAANPISTDALLSSMTPEQIDALINQLEEK